MSRFAVILVAAGLLAGCGDEARSTASAPAVVPTRVTAPAPPAAAGTEAPKADASKEVSKVTVPATFVESSMFKPFYGEVLHEKRLYLFGNKFRYDAFMATKEVSELFHKKLIGEGPNRMTLVVETDKDAPQMSDRIIARCKAHYGL